ncbi:MAG: hypothetical protein JNM27_11225 [Leptospirales bacterium]|nr:hypothetical protein [Leptospirales bacterium]
MQESSTEEFFFAGINFLDGSVPGVPQLAHPTSDLSRPAWPNLEISNGICAYSHTPFYYEREAGLKFKFCSPADTRDAQAMLELLALEPGAAAHPVIQSGAMSLSIDSLAPLKRERFLFAIDSNGTLRRAGIYGEKQFQTGIGIDQLPARFLHAGPSLLVNSNIIIAIYPFFGSDYLLLSWNDAQLAQRVMDALRSIAETNAQLKSNGAANPYVSEIRFGNKNDSLVEISSDTQGLTSFRLSGSSDSPDLNVEAFFFAGSSFIPEYFPGSGFTLQTNEGAKTYLESTALSSGAGPGRTWSADPPGSIAELKPSTYCTEALCGTPGISPAALPVRQMSASDYCRTSDIELTEWNPFGVMRSGTIDSGGKFVEIVSLRSCRTDALLLLAGKALPLPQRLNSGDSLLFAADSSLFQNATIPASVRSLSHSTPIQVVDLGRSEMRTLFNGADEDDRWIPKSQEADGTLLLHSLVISRHGVEFHESAPGWFRPDIEPAAMSPGYQTSMGPSAIEARLSEVYPAGSFNGVSIPGDEFFEIQSNATVGRGRLSLRVKRLSDGRTVTHHFPFPARQFSAFFTQKPQCFPGNFIQSDLFLPNEASEYTLLAQDRVLDTLQIGSALFATMDSTRTSLGLHSATNRFILTSNGTGRCIRSIASPGEQNSFPPFAIEESSTANAREFRIYIDQPAYLKILRGADFNQLQEQSIPVQNGDLVRIAASPTYRSVFRLDVGATPLIAGEIFRNNRDLFIETVAPSPVSGEEEWIRVCSQDGFAGDTLRIKDESSEDTIVPFYARTGLMLAPYTSDLVLAPYGCALIVDPDYRGHFIPPPEYPYVDRGLWTIGSTSAIGNGLSSGETIQIYRITLSGPETLATVGLPDIAPFHIPTPTGRRLVRAAGSLFDQIESWGVQ